MVDPHTTFQTYLPKSAPGFPTSRPRLLSSLHLPAPARGPWTSFTASSQNKTRPQGVLPCAWHSAGARAEAAPALRPAHGAAPPEASSPQRRPPPCHGPRRTTVTRALLCVSPTLGTGQTSHVSLRQDRARACNPCLSAQHGSRPWVGHAYYKGLRAGRMQNT